MWKACIAFATALALTACTGIRSLSNEVSTYSLWPADRKPATYAFERLPSQQARPDMAQLLEDAASRALEQAGFTRAAEPTGADVTVTLGARVTAYDRSPYDDPFWWHGGLWAHRYYYYYARPYWYPYWSPYYGA